MSKMSNTADLMGEPEIAPLGQFFKIFMQFLWKIDWKILDPPLNIMSPILT